MGKSLKGRRGFLQTVALAGAATQGQVSGAQAASAQQNAPPPPPPAPPRAAPAIQYPRRYSGRQLAMISFPLGGVAAGCLGLGGRGQLRDWQIFNRADHGKQPAYSFPAIWAQAGNAKPVARVLESRLMPPYEAAGGLPPARVTGLSRLENAIFTGEYPMARIAFQDRNLPVRVSLEAFTPFVPLDAEESGLPVAVLRYKVTNPGRQTAKVSIAYSLDNPVGRDSRVGGGAVRKPAAPENAYRAGSGIEGIFMTDPGSPKDSPMAGSVALCVMKSAGAKVSYLTGWPRAKWWASPLLFWDDFSEDGQLGPDPKEQNLAGSICASREIAPGASADFTFILSWHFPNRTPAWCGWSAPQGEQDTVIGNHYCTRFNDAWAAAEHTASNLESLEKQMSQFLQAMRDTTLPAAVKDAAMANLSTLASPTCFRTADGKFRGFEGLSDDRGCCHGSCTHVWNYESSTHYLFPSLARSLRESAYALSDRMDGVMPIRIALPEGKQTGGITAIDGTMGQIIKTYLDWQMSGDTEWLRKVWPSTKRAMEFSWVEGGWDGDRDGVPEGVQHNTFDVEFYGPNPMCGIYYLGALQACEEMSRAAGDAAFATQCENLRTRGSKWIDANLFNGEYYIQKVQGIPQDKIAKPLRSTGGAEDTEHPEFQMDQGCLMDQLVGQYVANYAGLGPLVDRANIVKTLRSIFKYNYRANLYHHDSVERTYALNDEAGLILCDYTATKRPRIPFPYFSEVWTGFEYAVASLMMSYGMVKEGVQCYDNVRRRFDGERRNPWDESECGHHYVRAMSAWSGVVALSGFRYEGPSRKVSIAPKLGAPTFRSFWSTGTGWGTFTQTRTGSTTQLTLTVLGGKLPCGSVHLPGTAGAKTSVTAGSKQIAHETKREDGRALVVFSDAVELAAGEQLVVKA